MLKKCTVQEAKTPHRFQNFVSYFRVFHFAYCGALLIILCVLYSARMSFDKFYVFHKSRSHTKVVHTNIQIWFSSYIFMSYKKLAVKRRHFLEATCKIYEILILWCTVFSNLLLLLLLSVRRWHTKAPFYLIFTMVQKFTPTFFELSAFKCRIESS
jgi:hypothetical protein